MSGRQTTPLPPWFEKSDYDFATGLKPLGWRRMLAIRNLTKLEPLIEQVLGKRDVDEYFESYLAAARPTARANDPNDTLYEVIDMLSQGSSFRFGIVPEEDELIGGETELIYLLRASPGRPVLIVDPEVPDGTLVDDFQSWLTAFRTHYPHYGSPARRAGRPSLTPNVKITKSHYATWVNRAVLPVFDLDLYAALSGRKSRSDHAIGTIFAPEGTADRRAWGRAARAAVRTALASEAAVAALIPTEAE